MNDAKLVWHQFRYDQRTFRRDPAAVGFTVVFPVIFLVIFVTIFGNDDIVVGGATVSGSTYYLPGIVTLGVASATYLNLAISLTQLRERGVLKRVRSTPVPMWAYIAGRIGTSVSVSIALTAVLLLLGRLLYDVNVPGETLPGLILTLVVGSATFSTLGFALAAFIPTEASAAPIANAVILPLYFISGIFVPAEQIPEGMLQVADAFPVKPMFDALLVAFDPATSGVGISGGDLAVLAAWGVAGLVVALTRFRWSPRAA
jgi:ABC-2 type transport system permease protein